MEAILSSHVSQTIMDTIMDTMYISDLLYQNVLILNPNFSFGSTIPFGHLKAI